MLLCRLSFGCFTVVHLNDNPCSYIRVIIANNRDENVLRPTDDAAYWPDDLSYIYGGRDIVRNYSTWLSMNTRTGRIANLLFLAGQRANGSARPSGPLVAMYLHSNYTSMKTTTYMNKFYTDGTKYNGIHLLLLDYLENGYWKLYYSNNNETDESNTILQSLVSGTFIVSNNLLARPFQKVLFGAKMFGDVLERHKGILNDDIDGIINSQHINGLVDDVMLTILENRTFLYRNGRDQNLQERFLTADQLELDEVSAINANYTNIWPNAQTRTNTVIIIFRNGSVAYIERTLKFDQYRSSYWSFKNKTFVVQSIKEDNVFCRKSKSLKLTANCEHIITCFFLYLILTLWVC